MKKFLTAILAVMYLTSSAGATMHMHYCMGDLVNTEWGAKDHKDCCCNRTDGTHKPGDGCCDDVNHFYKDIAPQLAAANVLFIAQSFSPAVPVSGTIFYDFRLYSGTKADLWSHIPPRLPGIPILLFKQSFLI